MKRSIASMKEKYVCFKKGSNKDEIFFTGEWSTKSIKIVGRIIEYHEAHTEWIAIRREDGKFDLKKILDKYPNLLKAEDLKIINLSRGLHKWTATKLTPYHPSLS